MSVEELIDPQLARQIEDGHRRLPAGLMGMRLSKRWSRDKVAKRMGLSDSGLANLETLRRGLKPATLIHWCQALGLPTYMTDIVLHQFLPGLFDANVGQWPPKISPGLKFFMDTVPFPVILLGTPAQDILYSNPEARRMSPWLVAASDAGKCPTNLVAEALTNPAVRENWVNWQELTQKAVYLLRARGEGIIDPKRMTAIKEVSAKNPDFARLWETEVEADAVDQNVTVIRHPDTGEEIVFTTFTVRCLYGEAGDDNAGDLMILVPTSAPDAAAA